MKGIHPVRLRNEQYMEEASSFRIFRHSVETLIPTHWHEFFEMSFVIEGEGVQVLNGKAEPMRRGSLTLMTPADFHEIQPATGQTIELYNMIFTDTSIRPELFRMLFSNKFHPLCTLTDEQQPRIQAEFERIWQEYTVQQFGSHYLIHGALERILIEFARLTGMSGQEQKAPSTDLLPASIRTGILYVQYHFRESLTLEEVAKQAGLSANYFSERFHQAVGISFQQYVQQLRIQFAASLLRVSDLPITEICYASGFSTISHFNRVFKQKFAVSPKEYRKTK